MNGSAPSAARPQRLNKRSILQLSHRTEMSEASLTLPPDPALPAVPAPILLDAHPGLTHGGIGSSHFYLEHAVGALFPIIAGFFLFGWRAMLVVAGICASTLLGVLLWRNVGLRGGQIKASQSLWLAVLLAMMLPAHLASSPSAPALWPLIPAAGLILTMAIWLLGGPGSGRIHPVLVTYLFLLAVFTSTLTPQSVLGRNHLFRGDVLHAEPVTTDEPWSQAKSTFDALARDRASTALTPFTAGTQSPERTWLSLEGLIRDRMPPLEDLIVAGHPAPIGFGSAVAIIIGGLFLLYRGLIDWRIPLLIFVSAYIAFIFLPIPIVITEAGPQWRWLAMRDSAVGWPLGLTFVHYELFAGAIPFMSFFLATTPAARPMARRARALYAILIGITAAVFQLYFSAGNGAYFAMFGVSLLTPMLDKLFRPRTLV
jgi:Na+-translocating ferredoxin:NAD+ oxidoreductase subunit D